MSPRADFQCLTRCFWQSHGLIHTPSPAFIYSYDKYLCHLNVCCCFFNQFSRVKENNKFTLCSSSQAASLLSVLSVAVLELPCSSCFLLIFLSYIRERHLAFFFFFFGKWQHFIKGEDSLPIKDVSAALIKPLARVPAQQHPIINKSIRK